MELDAVFEKNIPLLAESLNTVIQGALIEYEQLRKAGKKGELSHIYMSFLLSSVMCKLPWLRVDFFDVNDLDDMTDCHVSWDVPCISDTLYHDVNDLAQLSSQMLHQRNRKSLLVYQTVRPLPRQSRLLTRKATRPATNTTPKAI